MKTIRRSLTVLLCLLTLTGTLPLGITPVANAAELPTTKTVSVTVKLSGSQSASSFPATRSYDDGQYSGTLTRQNSTLKSVVRATPTVTYTYRSDIKYPNDKSASGQYSFPSTYASSYYDSVSGQYFPATLSKSGSPYFSGSVTSTTLYWTHYGYQYDPINHTKLGYMSNNSTTYYGGSLRYSDPPRQPADYYGPPAELGLGWVQYKAPEWDGALQDAEQEPWRSICIAYHGVARFKNDTGTTSNRYRRPVRIFYRRTANSQYIYQNYSGRATVTDTEITYTGTVTLKMADLTVTSLTTNKLVYEADETVTVRATVKNQGYSTASSFAVRLSTSPSVTTQNKTVSLAAGASTTLTYTFTAPTGLDNQSITLTVKADANNVIQESNENNNARSTAIAVNALRPDIAVVDSSITNWYAGKEVTVSATVRNQTAQPVPSVAVRLTIGGASYTENIPIPGNGSNLAVFRITVPAAGNYTVRVTADPDSTLSDINESNNLLTKTIQVITVPESLVADPDGEAMEQRYKVYELNAIPSVSSSNYHTWQEVRLENGSYVTKSYYVRLTTAFEIVPDIRIADADNPQTMESGFGFSVQCSTVLTTNYDHPDKLVGTQMVWVRYAESAYGQVSAWQNVRDSLAVKTGAAGGKSVTWQLAVNPYSVTNSRLHYTPLWFPDGECTAWMQAFYAWTPVGQLYEHKTDTLTIEGDMYDRITTVRR